MAIGRSPLFERYIGIDYSGAQTPEASLAGLRVYVAHPDTAPYEVQPPASPRKHWTRRGIATWMVEQLQQNCRTLVGIDHAFSFPLAYFTEHRLPLDWAVFLEDFHRHWPTDQDHVYVDFVREGQIGMGSARTGDRRWRRVTEIRARTAKSVFHFDVQGSVAKSTHAGLPWLRQLRQELSGSLHVWPFDGWNIPAGYSAVAEVYPSLWRRLFPQCDRSPDQHDAYSIAAWMRMVDTSGALDGFLSPQFTEQDRQAAEVEGWILGVA